MRHLISALGMVMLATAPLAAQTPLAAQGTRPTDSPAAKVSVMVYPFGVAAQTRVTLAAIDLSGMFASRALEGIVQDGRFPAINESANAALRKQLENAGTLAQFESEVQIRTDRQLQSKYMLTGFVESVQSTPQSGSDGKMFIVSTVNTRVTLYDVETGAVKLSESISVSNGLIQRVCPSGWKGTACRVAAEIAERKMREKTGGEAKNVITDATEAEAINHALGNAPTEIAKFIRKAIP